MDVRWCRLSHVLAARSSRPSIPPGAQVFDTKPARTPGPPCGPGATEESEALADEDRRTSVGQRAFDLALAAGFVLRTKAEGWKLFYEGMNVPALAAWERLAPAKAVRNLRTRYRPA
jgi:hypothetical protein